MGETHQDVTRLGKSELGSHAFEDHMPDRVASITDKESPRNKSFGVITGLAGLLERDPEVDVAYLCHQSVVQISKLRGEGNHFCAYRTIQMLLPEPFPVHSIPELQGLIEKAWSQGYNPHGRVETGGIIGTRKHIGTSEVCPLLHLIGPSAHVVQAQALFHSLNLPCKAAVFGAGDAWREILDSIEAYFTADITGSWPLGRIHITTRAPVFLQRPSHSFAVVGIERGRNGKRRLLVFDPGYQALSLLTPSSSSRTSAFRGHLILSRYRRGEQYLKRYCNFETLSLGDVTYHTNPET